MTIRCFVEVPPWGYIDDFDIEGMTENEINAEATEIYEDFIFNKTSMVLHFEEVDEKYE